jgi:WhiB family redox-sensing transcriptional regulator
VADVRRLPGPLASHWDWQLLGACRDADSALFFHPDNARGGERSRREAAAKQVCGSCVVRTECREHALRVREPYGVWGGLSETERFRLFEETEGGPGAVAV